MEEKFELQISGLRLPFVGIVDLVTDLDGKRTVIDFKTSSTRYQPHEVTLSDQLTAYQLARPDADQLALCVLVKTKEPRIEWHCGNRDSTQLDLYLEKTGHVANDIQADRFFKRPGQWCSWCDYLPVCTGQTEIAQRTLVQITE